MEPFNEAEKIVLISVGEANPLARDIIYQCINSNCVISRDYTKVGMYVNVEFIGSNNEFESNLDDWYSSPGTLIKTEKTKYGIGFVVRIIGGKISFIEFYLNDCVEDSWDGKLDKYLFGAPELMGIKMAALSDPL